MILIDDGVEILCQTTSDEVSPTDWSLGCDTYFEDKGSVGGGRIRKEVIIVVVVNIMNNNIAKLVRSM